jgi:hypothetical protein
MNRAATGLFDADFRVRNERLYMRDGKASQALERMLWEHPADGEIRLRSRGRVGNIIVARRESKKPILKGTPGPRGCTYAVPGSASYSCAPRSWGRTSAAPRDLVANALVDCGGSEGCLDGSGRLIPEEIAVELQVSRETVRNQIKAIFGKTGTHRQSELAALVARIKS